MARSKKHPKPILPTTVQDVRETAVPENRNYCGWLLALLVIGVIITLAIFNQEISAFFKGLLFVAGPGVLFPSYKIVPNDNKTDMFGNPITDQPERDPVDWSRSTKSPIVPGVYNHRYNRSKTILPPDQAIPSSDILKYAGFSYEWFVEPYAYNNAEAICKRRNGRLIYFETKEEFATIRNWTIRNVTDRHPLEEQPSYLTAGIRKYIDEKTTPYPDDDSTFSEISNLKWSNSEGQDEEFTGQLENFSPWCDDRNKALGSKKFEEGVMGIGWGSILKAIAEEEAQKAKSPMSWNAAKSVKFMLDLTVVMDFSLENTENESMGCLSFVYGFNDENKEIEKKLNEMNQPSGLPFICKRRLNN